MELYLAGENGKSKTMELDFIQKIKSPLWQKISVLESFYYVRKNAVFPKLYKAGIFKNVLLDSGAFTFMQSNKTGVNWERYISEYADFINHYDIKNFFELDIDKIVGLDEVEKMRDKLYSLTGKQPIPVWHINRGKQYFIDMCKQYKYVALGGYVIKEIARDNFEKIIPFFIKTAHENKSKIHGLGYTRIENLKKHHFDSVDSTAWLYGNRAGYLYKFNPITANFDKISKENTRLKPSLAAIYNFNEWLKFQEYARQNL